jgi:hypothetical protein
MKYLAVLALVLIPVSVLAHNTGLSIEKTVGEYLVDVGYSGQPQAGEAVSFDFDLKKQSTDADFGDVWVRITDPAGGTVLATGVNHAAYGGARLLYTFDRPGTYQMDVRYESGDTVFAEASFPLVVAGATAHTADIPMPAYWGLAGLVLGGGAAWILLRVRRS